MSKSDWKSGSASISSMSVVEFVVPHELVVEVEGHREPVGAPSRPRSPASPRTATFAALTPNAVQSPNPMSLSAVI